MPSRAAGDDRSTPNDRSVNGLRWAVFALMAAVAALLLWLSIRMDRAMFELHLMRLRCAVDPGELRLVTAWRVGLVVCAVAILLTLRSMMRRLARGGFGATTLRVAVALVLAIVTSDLVMRTRSNAGEPPRTTIGLPPVHADPLLGWVYDGPRTSVLIDDGRQVMYAMGDGGIRVHAQTDAIDPDKPTILFVGESVVLGLGVHWEEAFPTLVGQRSGLQIVNAGVHGYGDDQAYLRMTQQLAVLKRPIAVVTLTIADMLERDVATWRPRLEPADDGSLQTIDVEPPLWRKSPVVALFQRIGPWQSDNSVRNARAVFAAMDGVARGRGAYPLVLLTNYQRPCLVDASGRPSIEARLFDGTTVNHVRIDLDAAWIVHSNGHPDARAHARLADGVMDALRAAHVLPV